MSKYSCFVISPIGQLGSQIRQDADDLLELIIEPALEIYDFKVIRGDHRSEAGQIDVDVIQSVQESDLCIVDLTGLNPNVMYEIGRRDETGKPVIVLKRRGQELPVDLGTRRCIEYDLDSRRGVRDAVQQIRNFLEPVIERGFESTSAGASLSEIAAILLRVERKLDRMTSGSGSGGTLNITGSQSAPGTKRSLPKGLSAVMSFNLGMRKRDVELVEIAMEHLRPTMDKIEFLDKCAEQAAAIGSLSAGQMLIDCAVEFMDSDKSFHDKVDYLGCLVSFANKHDREEEVKELCDTIVKHLIAVSDGESDEDIGQVYNQENRLYFGLYVETDNEEYRERAITALKKAISYDNTEPAYYFNLATCEKRSDLLAAREHIDVCLHLSGDEFDEDHLSLAYRIYRAMDDPGASEILDKIREISPGMAMYLEENPRL